MKKNKFHIVNAWILLICFVAGQYMVYVHQHKMVKLSSQISLTHQQQAKQVLTEKCQLCDAMHHSGMTIPTQAVFAPVAASDYFYKFPVYTFTSISLILAGGRAPPAAGLFV
ncbi:MAG TPA: DUF2946 family protein [Mucilaginibacter sp.]